MNGTTGVGRPCAASRNQIARRASVAMVGILAAGAVTLPAAAQIAESGCEPLRIPRALRLQDAPASGSDRVFQNFDRPVGSSFGGGAGWWAFTGDLDGPIDLDDVLYAGDRLVLREGDSLVGTNAIVDAIPSFDGGRAMNATGSVAALIDIASPDGLGEAVVREGDIVARDGDVVPDGRGDRYESFSFVSLLDDGRVGFMAVTDGPSARDSVLVLGGEVLFREGDALPWDPELRWDGRFDEVIWNGRGDLIFEGNTSGPATSDRVLVLQREESGERIVEILAREGDEFTTEKGPVILDLVEQAALSEDGQWAARVLLRDVPGTLDEAIVAAGGIVVREGDPIAALPTASVGHFVALAIDGAGRVAAVAQLAGQPPAGVVQVLLVDGCAVTTTGVGATGMPRDAWLASFSFEDLAARTDGTLIFTATYGGSVAGDGLFTIEANGGCPADLDADGVVTAVDVLVLLSGWGPCPGFLCIGDQDLDGEIGMPDLLALLAAWGACPE